MTKAFLHEKHQAPLVNHESFRFTANLSEDDKYEQNIEKYLAEVECSYDTSYESQLCKKIAGSFEPKLAYLLLTEGQFDYQQAKEAYDDNSCVISLLPNLELTDYQKEVLESLIIAVYGFTIISYKTIKSLEHKGSSLNSDVAGIEKIDPHSIWYKVRKDLREELGENIDRNWFSKLTAKENKNKNVLNLYAPSPFYRDWINNKYGHRIRRCAQDIGVSFMVVDLVEPSVNAL